MKKLNILLTLIILYAVSSFAQDIELFKRDLNDHFHIPQIADSMSFDEFKILSINLRLIDAMEAMVVPGLIHFKISDKTTGWILVGTRLAGYGGMFYVNYHNNELWADILNYQLFNSNESKIDYFLAITSIGLVAGSYLYDWIHGRSLLEQKQQKIRFKYAIKLRSDVSSIPFNLESTVYPELVIQFNF